MKAISVGLRVLLALGACVPAYAENAGTCPVPHGYKSIVLRSDLPAPIQKEFKFAAMPHEAFDMNKTPTDSRPTTGLTGVWKRGNHWVLIIGNGISNTFLFEVYELSSDGETATRMAAYGAGLEQDLCGKATDYANWAASHRVDVLSSVEFDLKNCPVPRSFRAVVDRSDLPDGLKDKFKNTAMPGEAFNETDMGPPGTGLKLVWTNGRRWIVLLAVGGIAESFSVHDYEVNRDGTTVSELTPPSLPFGTCRIVLDEVKRLAKLPSGPDEQ